MTPASYGSDPRFVTPERQRIRRVLLLRGESWYPQVSDSPSYRRITRVLSNRVYYYGRTGDEVCSPESFRRWIRRWKAKI